ncbi:MAG: histone deacetylase [Pseudomonadota bacterium]
MFEAKNKTGLVFFPAFDWAISPTHPEREERLLYTQDQVMEEGIFDIPGIVELKPDLVTIKDIQRVHFCVPDPWQVTTESHFISAGGAKTVGMAVMDGQVQRGFALVRPPGHHAMRVVHGNRGFCNINIEAIMIEYLRAAYGIRRVAIVDTDCHHGDGTQDIYWHDPDTLFISIHQDGRTLYPGTGFTHEAGGPTAYGTTVNIPLPPNTSDEGVLYAVEHIVRPILDDFKPDIVVNSAGQDNHYSDPITNMNFSAQGYARLTELLAADIAVLEGGYAIEGALPYVNLAIILAMAGLDYGAVREPDFDPERIRQKPAVTAYIKDLGGRILENWQRRDLLRQMACQDKTVAERERDIYYDTDQIMEHQKERLVVCPDCAGALRIDSAAGNGARVLCVHIPSHACPSCREKGDAWFEGADKNKYDRVFLQDRPNDLFREKKQKLETGDRF